MCLPVLSRFVGAYPVGMGTGTESDRSATVLQAEGMVSVQVNCPVGDALQLMADRAVVQGMTIEDVALAVIDRSIRFGPITNRSAPASGGLPRGSRQVMISFVEGCRTALSGASCARARNEAGGRPQVDGGRDSSAWFGVDFGRPLHAPYRAAVSRHPDHAVIGMDLRDAAYRCLRGRHEAGFIKIAKQFGENRGIRYGAWRDAGGATVVLKKAGVTRTRG